MLSWHGTEAVLCCPWHALHYTADDITAMMPTIVTAGASDITPKPTRQALAQQSVLPISLHSGINTPHVSLSILLSILLVDQLVGRVHACFPL